jgi:hypothetical protein
VSKFSVSFRFSSFSAAPPYQKKYCFFLQDPVLFTGTIASNIAYANPATRAEIEEVAREANCDFVWRLPAGFDTESKCLVFCFSFLLKTFPTPGSSDLLTLVDSWQAES